MLRAKWTRRTELDMGGKSHTRTVKSATAASPEQAGPQRDHSRDDWAYHGIGPIGSADGAAHIVVEDVVFGLTERKGIPVLRELAAPAYGGFSWGYNGGGPARAAAAVLADALGLGDPDNCGLGADRPEDVLARLSSDFCWDVMIQLCDEWRLRRGAIRLRAVRPRRRCRRGQSDPAAVAGLRLRGW
jgi:hypothetical protein